MDNQREALGMKHDNILGHMDVRSRSATRYAERERVGERLFSYFEVMGKEPKLNEALKEITDATEQRNDC